MTNINFLLTISIQFQEIRLWELIKWSPERKCFNLLSNSLNSFFKEMYRDQFGEFVHVHWSLKGWHSIVTYIFLISALRSLKMLKSPSRNSGRWAIRSRSGTASITMSLNRESRVHITLQPMSWRIQQINENKLCVKKFPTSLKISNQFQKIQTGLKNFKPKIKFEPQNIYNYVTGQIWSQVNFNLT